MVLKFIYLIYNYLDSIQAYIYTQVRSQSIENIRQFFQQILQYNLLVMGCVEDKQIRGEEYLQTQGPPQLQKQVSASSKQQNIVGFHQQQNIEETPNPLSIKQLGELSEGVVSSLMSAIKQDEQEMQTKKYRNDQKLSRLVKYKQNLLQQYQKCQHFYRQHDIDNAYKACCMLTKIEQELDKKAPKCKQQIQSILENMDKMRQQITRQYKDVIAFEQQIESKNWEQQSIKDGITISTRREGRTVGVKVESIIDVPFQIVIAVLIEANLHKKFIPFMKISRQEKQVARNCRVGYALSDFPFLTPREAFYQGIAYDRLKTTQKVFLFTRSIHDRQDIQQQVQYRPQLNQKYVQICYKYFVVTYKPIDSKTGQIVLAMNVDSKMQFVPLWLQDKISQDYGQKFLKNIAKISKDYKGSIWQERVKLNPDLFEFFKKVIFEYIESKGNTKQT